MIDKEILDEILPVPELEELSNEVTTELAEEGFVVTNFHSGGVFYTLLMIVFRVYIEIIGLLRTVLNEMTVTHSNGAWLDLKAADYSKKRKAAQKAQGYVTISRNLEDGPAIRIEKGHIFKTEKDINGEELRFFSLDAAVLQKGALSVNVPIEAEKAGAQYNVSQGQITRTLTYIGDVQINNQENWLTQEGSDVETDESLRARCLRSWSELSIVPIRDTYINLCETIPGVLYASVHDQHPRGQGTVDVIITSEAGGATESLLEKCRNACEAIKEPDTDILVKSAEVVKQDISLNVTIPSYTNQDGLTARVESAIADLLRLRNRRELNELTHADIIYKVKAEIPLIKNVTVISPAADVILDVDKVILPGEITVSIRGV